MSAWLFDLGNTRLKCAPLQADGRIGESIALPHGAGMLAAALAATLPERFEVAYLASVATPASTAALIAELEHHCRRIHQAYTQPALAGVRIAYAQPQRLGVDRFLALLAVHAAADGDGKPVPALVCGVGTALTIDLLAADGRHVGGRIAPSPTLMRKVLHAHASQLPATGGRYSEFADDTDDALTSGCTGAALALIQRSVEAAQRELDAPPRLFLHGGGAEALRSHLPAARWAPTLVLQGLAAWVAAGADTPPRTEHR